MGSLAPIVPIDYYQSPDTAAEFFIDAVQSGSANTRVGRFRTLREYTLDHLRLKMDAVQTGTVTLYIIKLDDAVIDTTAVTTPASTGTLLATVVLGTAIGASTAQYTVSLDALTPAQRRIKRTDRILVVASAAGAWTAPGLSVMGLGRTKA